MGKLVSIGQAALAVGVTVETLREWERQGKEQEWNPIEPIRDLGSGLNYKKKGLQRLINLVLESRVARLVISHKDRLLRFESELIFSLCEQAGTQVFILNSREDTTFE